MEKQVPIGHRARGAGIRQTPAIPAALLLAMQFGRDFYVNSQVTAGDGTDPGAPLATVAAATALARSGDRVHIAAGHSENITNASGFDLNKAGVTYTGYGNGTARPLFTFTATDALLNISAANVVLANVQLTCAIDEVVTLVKVTAAGAVLDAVDYVETATFQAIQFLLTTNAADRIEVCNCRHYATTAPTGVSKWIQLVGVDDCDIHDNVFHLTFANNAGAVTISGSTALVRGRIARNTITQLGGTTQVSAILLVDSSTTHVHDNRVACGSTALAGIVDVGNAGYANENYALNTADKSGILDPVADS